MPVCLPRQCPANPTKLTIQPPHNTPTPTKQQLEPYQLLDYFAMVGDSADNVRVHSAQSAALSRLCLPPLSHNRLFIDSTASHPSSFPPL